MEAQDLSASKDPSSGFERTLAENCIEYFLFVIDAQADGRSRISILEQVRKAAISLATDLTRDYIWQRDSFGLDIKHNQGMWLILTLLELVLAVIVR